MKCSEQECVLEILKSRKLRLFFLLITLLFYSCQTQQEKKGASAIPVNKPASWENNYIQISK